MKVGILFIVMDLDCDGIGTNQFPPRPERDEPEDRLAAPELLLLPPDLWMVPELLLLLEGLLYPLLLGTVVPWDW